MHLVFTILFALACGTVSQRTTPNCQDWAADPDGANPFRGRQCNWRQGDKMCCGPWGNTFMACASHPITGQKSLQYFNCPGITTCIQTTCENCGIFDYCG